METLTAKELRELLDDAPDDMPVALYNPQYGAVELQEYPFEFIGVSGTEYFLLVSPVV